MPAVAPDPIAEMPIPPTTTDPANFDPRADTFFAYLKGTFRPGMIALAANAYANAQWAENRATAANDAASAANDKVDLARNHAIAAAASALDAANAIGAEPWTSGQIYAAGRLASSLINGRVYRRKTTGSGVIDPTTDTANWLPIGQFKAVSMAASTVDCSLGNFFTKALAGNITFVLANVPLAPIVYIGVIEVAHTSGNLILPAGGSWTEGIAPKFNAGYTHFLMFVTRNAGATTRWSALPNFAG